jgi:hypothetical protein
MDVPYKVGPPLRIAQVEAWNTCDIPLFNLLDFYSSIKVNTETIEAGNIKNQGLSFLLGYVF